MQNDFHSAVRWFKVWMIGTMALIILLVIAHLKDLLKGVGVN